MSPQAFLENVLSHGSHLGFAFLSQGNRSLEFDDKKILLFLYEYHRVVYIRFFLTNYLPLYAYLVQDLNLVHFFLHD